MSDAHQIPEAAVVRGRLKKLEDEAVESLLANIARAMQVMDMPSISIELVGSQTNNDVVARVVATLQARGWTVERQRGSQRDPIDRLVISL